jgi:hypothetical protein
MQSARRFAGTVPRGINEEDEQPFNIIDELMGHGSFREKRRDEGPYLASVALCQFAQPSLRTAEQTVLDGLSPGLADIRDCAATLPAKEVHGVTRLYPQGVGDLPAKLNCFGRLTGIFQWSHCALLGD